MTRTLQKWRLEWALLAALTAAFAGAVAILAAMWLRHEQSARVEATETVLQEGDALLDSLCSCALACSAETPSPAQWRTFSAKVDSAFAVRPDVQSLSVERDGAEVFHRQSGGHLIAHASPEGDFTKVLENAETEIEQGTLESAEGEMPVFVITRALSLPDGQEVKIKATLRREAVGDREESARRLVASLFWTSTGVLAAAFATCAAVLSLAVARERKREEKERQEEHLAFSGVLANGILHDFRNPMSAVRLDAQMLGKEMKREEGFRPQRVSDLADRIARTMERMDKIFTEFLFLAKPADETVETVSLCTVVRECLDTLGPRLEQAQLTAEFSPQSDCMVKAHPAAFRRALMNVLVNATQFADKNTSVRVEISLEKDRAHLDIHDDGKEIPKNLRERIFAMFFTGRPEGTGLGLFLARTAIRKTGGDLIALDCKGGATLRFVLPIALEKE